MIISRYLVRTIHHGTFAVLMALVALGVFFMFVGELDDVGKGTYDLSTVAKYVALSVPGRLVEFMPIAVLLGSILNLGSLASNGEIIAMQASGVSLARLIVPLLQAAAIFALLSFLLSEWIVPVSETSARALKNMARGRSTALYVKEGLWIKDESRVLHIDRLLPGGIASNIKIFKLDQQGDIESVSRVGRAIPIEQGWELQQVERSIIGDNGVDTLSHDRLIYSGNLSSRLLEVLMIEPRRMSSVDLSTYLSFLNENKLDASAANLVFWRKISSPLAVIVMCLLALPFVLGAQRQANAGHRLLIGILLGLAFVVIDRLVTQLAVQFGFNVVLVALLPNLIFLTVALFLLVKRQPHASGG